MRKAFVTGCCGFIGHHLTRRLKQDGWYIVGVDDMSAGDKEWIKYCDDFFEEQVELPVNYPCALEDKFDVVFHLAAKPRVPYSIEHPLETHEANTTATLVVLNLISKLSKPVPFVYSSSSSVYGNQPMPLIETMTPAPLSPYAAQKLMGEHYCRIFSQLKNVPTVSLRYFNVYGSEQTADHPYAPVVAKFLKRREDGKFLTIYGDGEQRRDFTHVDDVVEANLAAYRFLTDTEEAPIEYTDHVFNIGRGHNISINELARLISPKKIAYEAERPGDIRQTFADISQAVKCLNWMPRRRIEEWIQTQL